MATQYASPPTSLSYGDGFNTVPNGMLWRLRRISGMTKQTIKITPSSGQGSYVHNQKITCTMPMNSLLDYSSFEGHYTGKTNLCGVVAGGPSGYTQVRYFPRNTQSIIENIDYKINSRTVQSINQYGYIYNVLSDFQSGTDALSKNRISQNADPSNKSYYKNGKVFPQRGYPIGLTGATNEESGRDAGNYVWRNWLGLPSGGASTNFLHSDATGEISIEITLAGPGVLMLGASPGTTVITNLTADATYTGTSEVNLAGKGTPGTASALVATEAAGFTLSDVFFTIDRIDLPPEIYEAMRDVLISGAVYKLYYPNYQVFQGTGTSDKSGSLRFALTTESLDMCIGTFQVNNRDVIGAPINSFISDKSQLEYGQSKATLSNLVSNGHAVTFNNSRYFLRNGSGIKNCFWKVGYDSLPSQTIPEQFETVLKAFGSKNDTLGGIYPGLKNLADYQNCFYGHVLSLQDVDEQEVYTVSGLNSSNQPVSIEWTYAGGEDVTGGTDANNIETYKSGNCMPIVIACYSSHVDITVGRNVQLFT